MTLIIYCSLSGQAALSLNGLRDGTALRRELTEIVKAADRAFDEKTSGPGSQAGSARASIDFNALVTQVAEMLPPVLGADITLRSIPDPDLGRVKADPDQLNK